MTTEGCISIRTEGGFAHLPRQAVERQVDLTELDDCLRDALFAAVDRARFFDRANETVRPSMRDTRIHHVAIRMGERHRSLQIAEPFEDQPTADLVLMVRRAVTSRS